jgi:NAD(P)-dependent dehydrogenase (short-subunit alcohol dehydrogenase family)
MEASGVALVTGAGRGIGRAVAIELARRGFDVVATMRDPSKGDGLADEAGAGTRLTVERLDVNDESTMHIPAGLRVLVNNAGVESDNLPLEVMPANAWRAIYETNVFGLVAVTRHAIPVLRESGGGVICNVTSSSLLAPVPFLGAYRSSKAAVSAIGESLMAEVAKWAIRVLEILPGPIETDMLLASDRPAAAIEHEQYAAQAERLWESRQSVRAMYTAPAEAARRIADAILDDDAPLRVGCDDLSEGMIKGWRNAGSDEAWLRPMLRGFVDS